MLENEEEIHKLSDLLKKKFPQLNEDEINKISQNLFRLGLFLVELQIEKCSKLKDLENFEQIKKEPP